MEMLGFKNDDIYKDINKEISIDMCPQSNSIRFSIKREGFVYAYVLGDFNQWKRSEDSKLTWQVDPNDGKLKMMKVIKFNNGLKTGEYEYQFVLVDYVGNEVWANELNGNYDNLKLSWNAFEEGLEIKSSSDIVTPNMKVELIGVYNKMYGDSNITNVSWFIEPAIDGVNITNGVLTISDNVIDGTEIIVKAMDKSTKSVATKKITVSNEEKKGILVHFVKSDKDYSGANHWWNCWMFSDCGLAGELNFTMDTDMGRALILPENKFIIRKKTWGYDWSNDWAEQTPAHTVGENINNVYVIYGDYNMYISLEAAILNTRARVECAIMDDKNKIRATLSHEPLIGTEFNLYINGVKAEGITTLVRDKVKEVILKDLPSIKPSDLLEIRASNMFMSCQVLMRNYLDSFYYGGDDMGATFTDDFISLRVWAPTAYKVEAALYSNNTDKVNEPLRVYAMNYEEENGTHRVTMRRRDNENKFFLYKAYFRELDGEGNEAVKITYAVDPYAVAVGANGDKGALVDINSQSTKPQGWDKDNRPKLINQEDSILYEMHVRDFTISKTSGVKARLRGTYLGAVEERTTCRDRKTKKVVKTGIDHLKELGVTHAHLLPVFDFGSVDEAERSGDGNRNWGYDPKNYNVPEGSYSTNPFDPATRIKEFRTMVKKFHKNGIRVVMDMVYNHMMETANMDKLVPGYYFRTDSYGNFTNGSGCGNEMASEKPMVRKFIVDSNLHWVKNYHIDGLRFDLMELIDLETIKQITNKAQEVDKAIIVYGEPWKGGDSPVQYGTSKGCQRNNNFSVFNDTYRDALRGSNHPSKGFINGDYNNVARAWTVVEGIKGSVNGLTAMPKETINYIEAHDNYAIWDQIEKSQNYNIENGRFRKNIPSNIFESSLVRQNLLGAGIILTSQGIPFFQEGSEMLRTKQGDHNSYKSSDKTNEINWDDKLKYKKAFEYYKGLINLRKEHPAFRMKTTEDVREHLNVYFANSNDKSGVIIAHYCNHANEDKWKNIVVIYNSTNIDNYDVNNSLPQTETGMWNIVVNHEKSGCDVIDSVHQGNVPSLKSHSMMVIYS